MTPTELGISANECPIFLCDFDEMMVEFEQFLAEPCHLKEAISPSVPIFVWLDRKGWQQEPHKCTNDKERNLLLKDHLPTCWIIHLLVVLVGLKVRERSAAASAVRHDLYCGNMCAQ